MVWIPSQMEVDGEVSLKGEDGADVGVALGSGDGGRGGPLRLRLENEGKGCHEVGGGGGGGAGVEGEDGEQWPSRLRLTNDGISAGLPSQRPKVKTQLPAASPNTSLQKSVRGKPRVLGKAQVYPTTNQLLVRQ